MPLIEIQNLRDWFAVPTDIKDPRLTFCISAASRTLRSWVTDSVYSSTSDPDRVEDLKTAEANLTIYHLLLNTGARIRPSGVAKKEHDAGGATTNNVTNEYLTPEELQALRQGYFAAAEAAALKHRPAEVAQASSRATTLTLAGGWRGGYCLDD